MQRSLLILSLSFLMVACAGSKKGSKPAGSSSAVFSWEKKEAVADAPAAPAGPQAPADAGKALVVAFNEKQGLISLLRSEKAEVGAKLQLTKGDKALTVQVLRADDKVTVVGIVAGQLTSLTFSADEEVGCGVIAAK